MPELAADVQRLSAALRECRPREDVITVETRCLTDMAREPLDWEKNPQSSGLTFEGSVDRLRFAASTPKGSRRSPSQISTGFK